MNRNTHTQRERDPMGAEKKEDKIYICTYKQQPTRHGGRLGAVVAQGGRLGVVWVPGGIFGLILLLPKHLGRADCKRESRRVGKGSEGGAAGVGSSAGEMPKNQNKTRFHFVCTSLGAGERGREGGRGRRTPTESRRAQTRACGHVPPQPPQQPFPLPRPPLPAHPASPAKSELARLPRLRRTKPSPIPEPALTVSKVTGASSAC